METQNKTWDSQPGWAGSRSESWRKEKHCCGAAEGHGERKRGRGSRAEKTERENKQWGARHSTRKRKIRQGRRLRSSERKKGQKKTPER